MDSAVAEARAVRLVTIFINKRRFEKIGIFLQGSHIPEVVRTENELFHVNDLIFAINGRLMIGSKQTSFFIWVRRHMTISVYR